jgi:7-carboxy-7-deazaguanine synthase
VIEKLDFNINEIFYSIQGEGTRAGLPCIFVRLQGCLLRCVWCDTPYALERKEIVSMMTGKEIADEVSKYDCKFLMFTGGEPLEQENIFPLINYFCDLGYDVVIETNGQADVSKVDQRATKIMDLKCPDSLMHKKNNYKNIDYLNKNDEVKFVVGSEKDFNFAEEICEKYNLEEKVNTILISPVFGKIELNDLAELIKKSKHRFRMQFQMHKYIWEPNRKGV